MMFRILVYVLLLASYHHTHAMTTTTSIEKVKAIATNFEKSFREIFYNGTGYERIKKDFNRYYDEGNIALKGIDGMKVCKDFAQNIERVLSKKREALLKIKYKAEDAYKNYEKDKNLKDYDYELYSEPSIDFMKKLKIDPAFSKKTEITRNDSIIQMPANVYIPGDHELLNSIKWTSPLTEVFQENDRNSGYRMSWQYVGLTDGISRSYPGAA